MKLTAKSTRTWVLHCWVTPVPTVNCAVQLKLYFGESLRDSATLSPLLSHEFFVGERSLKVLSDLSSFTFSKVYGQGQALPIFRHFKFVPSVYLH